MTQDDSRHADPAEGQRGLFCDGTCGLFCAGTLRVFCGRTGLDRDHRGLAAGEVAAAQVDGQHIRGGVVAVVGGECGRDAGGFAGAQAIAAVEEATLAVDDDGVAQAVLFDVFGEGVEFVVVECGEDRGGRVGFEGDGGLTVSGVEGAGW